MVSYFNPFDRERGGGGGNADLSDRKFYFMSSDDGSLRGEETR